MRALGLTGAGPGRTVRTTGPAKGNPVPARPAPAATPAAARCGPALGGRLHPRADPARGSSLHRLRHGACARRPHRRLGHQHAHGAPGRGRRPGTGDPGRASTATAVIPGAWSTTATTDPSHLSIAYTGRLVDEGTGRLGRSRGLLPAQAPPPRPWASPLQARGPSPGTPRTPPRRCKPPASAGPVLARRPLEGPRRPLEAATARWVNWYNHTRPHLTNDDDLSPAAAEHRYHRNHTTTATTPGRLFWGVRVGLVWLLGRPGAGSCPNLPQRRPGPG